MAQYCQKYASHQKKLQIKVVRHWISSKKVRELICLSPPGVELGDSKDWQVPSIILKGNSKLHSIYCSILRKIRTASKKFQIKVVRNWISSKKVRERVCLSPCGVELGCSKEWQVRSIILKGNSKLHSFWAQCCQKYASHQIKV